MYCGQCGKKVMENMLFCPFCGSPIVIPDQDDEPKAPAPAVLRPVQEKEAVQPEPEKEPAEAAPVEDAEQPVEQPVSLFQEDEPVKPEPKKEEEKFVPLLFDFEDDEPEIDEEDAAEEEYSQPVEDIPEEPVPAPVRRSAQTQRPQSNRKRPANTYIPVKEINPADIFMDGLDEDEYDLDDDDDDEDFGDDDFYYEDRDEGGFFQRHIRGVVGFVLFLVLIAICAFWANTDKGQMTLARFNMAWRAQPYAELGYQAYLEDNDLLAARFYEKALSRDEDNYDYAHSAMVAYYEADNIDASSAMLKRCIALEPNNPEPYKEMLILYPDAQLRPWEIKELIRQGYERTGDSALKP